MARFVRPECGSAALNRTSGGLKRLDSANEAIAASGSLESFLQANVDWHVGVATAGHNEILAGIMLAR